MFLYGIQTNYAIKCFKSKQKHTPLFQNLLQKSAAQS